MATVAGRAIRSYSAEHDFWTRFRIKGNKLTSQQISIKSTVNQSIDATDYKLYASAIERMAQPSRIWANVFGIGHRFSFSVSAGCIVRARSAIRSIYTLCGISRIIWNALLPFIDSVLQRHVYISFNLIFSRFALNVWLFCIFLSAWTLFRMERAGKKTRFSAFRLNSLRLPSSSPYARTHTQSREYWSIYSVPCDRSIISYNSSNLLWMNLCTRMERKW